MRGTRSTPEYRRTLSAYIHRNREQGSISVLTVIGLGAIVGAFFYAATIGNRIGTTMRLRTAADAAALGAAAAKARTMNYAAFTVMAQTILYPLSRVSHYVSGTQIANSAAAVCAAGEAFLGQPAGWGQGCVTHVLNTSIGSRREDLIIQNVLNSLNTLNQGIDTIAPVWAASVAYQTATHSAYQSGAFAIDMVQLFPTPDGSTSCSTLGLVMADPTTAGNGKGKSKKDDCEEQAAAFELAYDAMSGDETYGSLDTWDWMLATASPPSSFKCANAPSGAKKFCDLFANNNNLATVKSNQASNLAKSLGVSTGTVNGYINKRDSYQAQITAGVPANTPPASELTNSKVSSGCAALGQVPKLGTSWQSYQRSVVMTMQSKSSDRYFVANMESLRQKTTTKQVPTGSALGIGCAQHYSLDAAGSETLATMNWRARLVPCAFSVAANVDQVKNCGGNTSIGLKFQSELALGIASEWKF